MASLQNSATLAKLGDSAGKKGRSNQKKLVKFDNVRGIRQVYNGREQSSKGYNENLVRGVLLLLEK